MFQEQHVVLNAPVERVFECLRQENELRQWMKGFEGNEFIGPYDPEMPLGARFRQRIREGGRVATYEGEITAFERNRFLGLCVSNRAFSMRMHYRLEPHGPAQTKFVRGLEVEYFSPMARIMGRIFRGFTRSLMRKQLDALKKHVESA